VGKISPAELDQRQLLYKRLKYDTCDVGLTEMNLAKLPQEMKNFIKAWFKRNRVLVYIAIVIIIVGILPIFPSTEKEETVVPVPTITPDYGGATPQPLIKIWNDCNNLHLSTFYQSDSLTLQGDAYSQVPKSMNYTFGGYTIHIFALRSCDDVVSYDSLRPMEEKKAIANSSSVFGYFEKCVNIWKGYPAVSCQRTPFMISDQLEIVSPDKQFKLSIIPIVKKILNEQAGGTHLTINYDFKITITYPKLKPLPYVKWVASTFIFILDPIKNILRYASNNWFYK